MITSSSLNRTPPEQKEAIWQYILSNHVMSISAWEQDDIWSANLFYAADVSQDCVYVMSSKFTHHGQLMQKNAVLSGTISEQAVDVTQLKGIQFLGIATILPDSLIQNALSVYQHRFPVAKERQETLWKIAFTRLKFTDNSLGFGTKMVWQQL